MKPAADWKTELLRRQGRDADWDWVAVWPSDIEEIQKDALADNSVTKKQNEEKN